MLPLLEISPTQKDLIKTTSIVHNHVVFCSNNMVSRQQSSPLKGASNAPKIAVATEPATQEVSHTCHVHVTKYYYDELTSDNVF